MAELSVWEGNKGLENVSLLKQKRPQCGRFLVSRLTLRYVAVR